jgi:glycine cleavage system H protein
MSETRYTDQHEWIRPADGAVGITKYAVEQLGDAVFVELPEIGKIFKKGEQAAVVESVKAASEIYAPVGGEVIARNQDLADEPALLNQDAEDKGWFFKLKLADPDELSGLMTAEDYAAFVKGL